MYPTDHVELTARHAAASDQNILGKNRCPGLEVQQEQLGSRDSTATTGNHSVMTRVGNALNDSKEA